MREIPEEVKLVLNDKSPEEISVSVLYKNYRGESSERRIIPLQVFYSSTEYHKEKQWLLKVWDIGKSDYRTYALKDIEKWKSFPGFKKVIVISGLPGSGSSTTAKFIAEKLSISHFSIGQVFKDISRGKMKEQFYYPELKKLCELKGLTLPDFTDKDDSHGVFNLWSTDLGKSKNFHEVLDALQVVLSEKEGVVIDGKLAISMIPKADLKVWLKASSQVRVERAAKRDNLSVEEADILLKKIQEKLRSEWNKIYNIDCFAQEDKADIVIDTTNLTPEEVADKILSAFN